MISARKTIALMFFLGGLSVLILNLASGFWLIYLFPVLFGLSYGAIINLKPLVIFEYFGTKKVGRLYGLVLASYTIGASVGPLVTGYIFDRTRSYELPFVINLVLACIAILGIMAFAYQANPSRRQS